MRISCCLCLLSVLLVSCSSRRDKSLVIQPLGFVDKESVDSVESALTRAFGIKVHVATPKQIPARAYVNIKTPRYRADSLIRILRTWRPDSVGYIMGLLAADISFSKKDSRGSIREPEDRYRDWGIFGLGFRPGESSVISTFRLKHPKRNVMMARLQKIAIHEFGHNLGIDHCESEHCVMRDAAESIYTIDGVAAELCETCRSRL